MNIILKKTVARKVGFNQFVPFGVDGESAFGYHDSVEIDLCELSDKKLSKLRDLLVENKDVRGTGVLVKDIDQWNRCREGDASVKPRSVMQFGDMLKAHLSKVPGYRIYEVDGDSPTLAYVVDDVTYHPRRNVHGDTIPAHVTMRKMSVQFGFLRQKEEVFWEQDCRNMTIPEALARKNYRVEDDDLRREYLEDERRFLDLSPQVGLQVMATGFASDDVDGNEDRPRWDRSRRVIDMNRGDRCVVDVFFENPSDKRDRRARAVSVNEWFWENYRRNVDGEDGSWEDDDGERPDLSVVPIHPYLVVYCLSKHLRVKIHVRDVVPYVYDTKLSEKLVLDDDTRKLVEMLIEHEDGGFRDIVQGKSGGAVVLLAGPPGVGKTLTAEVYAESEEKPLFSVQCSQLGTDPDNLEKELLKVFERSARLGAVLLLDEADVYIRQRRDDLTQNAIVGVFLRVLEYQTSVLFMTTNRPDTVDDAIASRCVARLDYQLPSKHDQARIWRVLSQTSGVVVDDDVIDELVLESDRSGRDVKNLLKLAGMMSASTQEPITADLIRFVQKFKPAGS